ncbi:MAG: CdaR family protein [bacterium]|nr:CdaR family protein [bacterium]
MKKSNNSFVTVFKSVGRFIDQKVITPLTKFLLGFTKKSGESSKSFERWLNKKNTLTFLSLALSLAFFFLVDSKSIVLVETSAEVLYNQPVEAVYNQEAYVVEGLPESVDVTLIGRRSDLYLAKQISNQKVTADISGLEPGTHKVNLKYENSINTINYKLDPSTVTIIVYPKVSEARTVNIDILNQDKLNSKLSIKSIEIDQSEIIIKGAGHALEQVSTVKALVDIENLVDPTVGVSNLKDVPLIAYDAKGQVVNVEMVPETINATISIVSPSKEVPIKVIPKGNVEFGLALSSATANITKVIVYGDEEAINELQYIPVEIDVTGLNSAKEFNVVLNKPAGIRYISETSVNVKVALDKEVSVEVPDILIEHTGLDSNYKAVALSDESSKTSVIVKATQSVIDSLDTSTIKATIDLSGYGVGDHEVEVAVTGDELKAMYTAKTKKVKIRIAKK